MSKFKKPISLLLSLALLVSSVFVGGIFASAQTDLFTTTMTFDDDFENNEVAFNALGTDRGPGGYTAISVSVDGTEVVTNNGDQPHYIGCWGVTVADTAAIGGNGNAMLWDTGLSYDYSWLPRSTVYTHNVVDGNLERFKPKANTTYEIRLKYYAAKAPTNNMVMTVRWSTYDEVHFGYTFNESHIWCEEVFTVTGATDGWVEAVAKFTTPASPGYMNLVMSTTGSSSAKDVEIYTDDITVSECAAITAHDFDGNGDKVLYASQYDTVAELEVPTRDGYIFSGVYSDAALTNKVNTSELALNYSELYYAWNELEDGEYYCGFEDYTADTNGLSYDSSVSEIVSGDTYAGGYAMQNTLANGELVSFELRDKTYFNVVKGTEYKISFAYKSTADAKIYAGLAAASHVPSSAYALVSADLSATNSWKTASIDVTLDKGTVDGFVLALMLSADDATVVIDDVFVTYPVDKETVNMPSIEDPGTDWYPTLGVFEGVVFPDASAIWDGKTLTAPVDSDEDGWYEINSAEELAYAIYYSGTVGEDTACQFKLTKDIYLNDITKINWSTGEVADGYTARKWYSGWVSATHSIYFEGTIDGNYHTVYGLYVQDHSKSYCDSQEGAGLIPKAKGAVTTTVKNLAIDKAFVDHFGTASAFVALADEDAVVNMSNCYAGKDVTLIGGNAAVLRGRGWRTNGGVFENCYSLATTSPQIESGSYGLVGYLYEEDSTKITFKSCYNANGPLSWGTTPGYYPTASNCYETVASNCSKGTWPLSNGVTVITDVKNMQGADALATGDKMIGLNAFGNNYVATDTYPTLSVFKGIEVSEVWDGSTKQPTETDEEGNVLIHNGQELAWIISNGGEASTAYKLTNNIYLNRLDVINWKTGAAPTGYTPTPWYEGKSFTGTIDGDGYTVYGLYHNDGVATSDMKEGYYNSVGLVPFAPNGANITIKNLGLDNMFINATYTASPFIGAAGNNSTSAEQAPNITIEQCYVGANVNVTAFSAAVFRGYSQRSNLVVNNCYNLGTINSSIEGRNFDPTISWVVSNGWNNSRTVNNFYNATGAIYEGNWNDNKAFFARNYAAGKHSSGDAAWYATQISAENMQGLDALTRMPDLNKDADGNDTGIFMATEGYPILTIFDGKMDSTIKAPEVEEDENGDTTTGDTSADNVTYTVWDGSTATAPTKGTGTEADPFLISEAAELYYVIKNGGGADTYYKLTKDIYLNDLSKVNWLTGTVAEDYQVRNWISGVNAVFQGHIDGNLHTVHGIFVRDGKMDYSTYHSYGAGLISHANEGTVTIKNLAIDNSFIRYESGCAAFVGAVGTGASVKLTNCYTGANVGLDGGSVSGLVGVVLDGSVNILNCYSLASVISSLNTGLVGNDYHNNSDIVINNSFNANGPILSKTSSGVVVNNCFQTADGGHTSGVTTISKENMMGDDVLTNPEKMAGLAMANAYITSNATFAQQDIYTYLPAGTKLDSTIKATFYDNMMAPLAESAVLLRGKMLRGAYVKFAELPDAVLVNIPLAKADKANVRGGAIEILKNAEYYGIESEMVSEHLDKQAENSVNYLFVTDIHNTHTTESAQASARGTANMKQMELLAKLARENDEIDFIVLGGDLGQGYSADKQEHLTYLRDLLTPLLDAGKPVFAVKGNHDDNSYHDNGALNSAISNMDWNVNAIKYLEDGLGFKVVHDSDDENSNYYYYDLEAKKTRVIVLNASDYPQEYDENGNLTWLEDNNASYDVTHRSRFKTGYTYWGYSDNQIEWIANEALNADDGWNYVFFSHMGIDHSTSGKETYDNGDVLREILDQFQNKNYYLNEGFGIDRDWTETNGKILSYQFGHEHKYDVRYNEDIDLWQIATTSSGGSTTSLKQNFYSENQLNFDLMSVNENYIYKHNIGGDTDARMISSYQQLEGDINVDGEVDIVDLVNLAKVENGDFLPTARAKNQNLAKIRSIIFGDIIAVPDYYQDEASENADKINAVLAEAGDNTASFLHWTDAHWSSNHESSYKLLKYLSQTTSIDKVNFTGDIGNDGDPTPDGLNEWRKVSLMLPNHHSVTGNHEYTTPHLYEYVLDGEGPSEGYTTETATPVDTDGDGVPNFYVDGWDTGYDNDDDGVLETYIDGQKTKQNIYEYLLAPEFEMYADDIKGNKEGELCYYIDNEAEKTRYMYLKNSRGFGSGPSIYEYQWMVETLESTPDDWHIVAFAHEWFQSRTSYPDPVDVYETPENSKGVQKLFDAYNSREIGYSNYFSVPYDFSGNTATVELLVAGDNHRDSVSFTEGGIPMVILITDGQGRSKNNKPDIQAVKDTADENAVSAFILDYDNDKLTIVRTGAGGDITVDLTAVGGTYVAPTTYTDLLVDESDIIAGLKVEKTYSEENTAYSTTDYIELTDAGKTWKFRDDVTFRFDGLKATPDDFNILLYTGNEADEYPNTYIDLDWSTGCSTPNSVPQTTYPVVYEVDENGYVTYVDLTAQTSQKVDGQPKFTKVRFCIKGLTTDVVMTYNEFIVK